MTPGAIFIDEPMVMPHGIYMFVGMDMRRHPHVDSLSMVTWDDEADDVHFVRPVSSGELGVGWTLREIDWSFYSVNDTQVEVQDVNDAPLRYFFICMTQPASVSVH